MSVNQYGPQETIVRQFQATPTESAILPAYGLPPIAQGNPPQSPLLPVSILTPPITPAPGAMVPVSTTVPAVAASGLSFGSSLVFPLVIAIVLYFVFRGKTTQ
jgi:hypothetical protein